MQRLPEQHPVGQLAAVQFVTVSSHWCVWASQMGKPSCVQSTQIAPPTPHAFAVEPEMHAPAVVQHPDGQVAASQAPVSGPPSRGPPSPGPLSPVPASISDSSIQERPHPATMTESNDKTTATPANERIGTTTAS
jgi:hypothetical protein